MASTDRPMAQRDPEVPEADALEQSEPAAPGPPDDDYEPSPRPVTSFEVPEADAIEQSQELPEDDDWR